MPPEISMAMFQSVINTGATMANPVRSSRRAARTMPRKMMAKNGLAIISLR